jgi:peptidoglycan/xylan/chitin deacetylase (PgdA/CDA1 family)
MSAFKIRLASARFTRRLGAAFCAAVLCAPLLGAAATAAAKPAVTQRAGVPVLIYHEVVTDSRAEGETVISLANFTEQMQLLADEGFATVGIDELARFMKGEITLPAKAIVLTFEDGWKSVLNATPVLERLGFKASFWIITSNGIGGDYLGWSDIEKLATNPRFEIYSHTVSHPWDERNNLVTWVQDKSNERGRADALYELSESRRVLEQHLGRPVRYLAWPSGWFNDTLVSLAQEAGYTGLLTAESGLNRPGDDVLRIKRTFVDGSCDMLTFRRTVTTGQYYICQVNARSAQRRSPG